jgi:hypothetical protein
MERAESAAPIESVGRAAPGSRRTVAAWRSAAGDYLDTGKTDGVGSPPVGEARPCLVGGFRRSEGPRPLTAGGQTRSTVAGATRSLVAAVSGITASAPNVIIQPAIHAKTVT